MKEGVQRCYVGAGVKEIEFRGELELEKWLYREGRFVLKAKRS